MRLYAVIFYPAKQAADAADYHRLATCLAVNHEYVSSDNHPTAWRPPGYPFFLAGIYSILGVNELRACLAQAILGGLTVLALMYLGALLLGWNVAVISGVIAALYPGLVYLPRILLSENLALFLLLIAICVTVKVIRSEAVWLEGLLGVVLGLSVLVRGANVFTAAFLLGLIFLRKWRATKRSRTYVAVKSLIPATLAMIAVIAPWAVRNYMVFGRLTTLATQDGITLYASYWPPKVGSKRIWGNLPGAEDPVVAAAFKSGDEVVVAEYLKKETFNRLIAEPSYFFKLWPSKLLSLLAPFDWETLPHSPGSTRSFNWGYVLILLPAALGSWTIFRASSSQTGTLLALPASTLIQSLIFYGSPRFRLSAEPIAIIMAAAGIVRLTRVIFNTTGKDLFGFYDPAKFDDRK